MQFAPCCRVCDLNFSRFNVGDGPAAFLTLIVGAIVVALALWVESVFRPPFWVHILLLVSFTTAAILYGLRVGKAALPQAGYRDSARQARTLDVMGPE